MLVERYRALIPFLLLTAIAAAFYTVALGRLPLEDADEATYAMVLREMIESGNYLIPRLDGSPWVDKPPLYFWLAAASVKLLGFNEFSLRLPSALFGIAAVILTALIARQLTQSAEAALFAGLALTAFPLFLSAVRNVRLDVPVTAAILAALYCFLKGGEIPAWRIGVGIAIGIGILLKSVIALLAVPLLLVYALIYRDWRWLKNGYVWLGLALGIAIALPWHLLMAQAVNGFFIRYFGFQIGRAAENILESQISAAYVLWVFFRYGQPWSSLAIAGAAGWIAARLAGRRQAGVSAASRAVWFSLTAFAFLFGAFLAPKTKLITYFIPSYPFLVIFLGALYAAVRKTDGRVLPAMVARAAVIAALVLSVREAFFDTRLYVTAASADEKAIGLLLAGEPNASLYLYEFPPDQSIQYYSRRPVKHITAASDTELAPPFHLVIPVPLIAENGWLAAFPPLSRGEYLALYRIE